MAQMRWVSANEKETVTDGVVRPVARDQRHPEPRRVREMRRRAVPLRADSTLLHGY